MTSLRMMAAASVLMATGLLAGCNILEGAFSESDDPDMLLEDARHARANGDLAKAVKLLEKALVSQPSHPVVRFELASTLMRREGLDLLTLERVTSHLLNPGGTQGSAGGQTAATSTILQSCTFGPLASVVPFDPRNFDDFDRIASAEPTLRRVLDLLNDPSSPTEAPAMPPALTQIDVCEIITPGGLDYNRATVLDALQSQFGSASAVTGALNTNAVALTLAAYVDLFEQPDLTIDWYIVDDQDVGACMADEQYDLFLDRARAQVYRAGQALLSIDLLLHHAGNSTYEEILDDAIDLYYTLESDEVDPCGI